MYYLECTSTAFGLPNRRIEDSQITALSYQKNSSTETEPECVQQGISFCAHGGAPPVNGPYIQWDLGQEFTVNLSNYYVTSDNIPRSTNRGTRRFFLLEMRRNPNGRTVVRDIFIPLVYKQNMRVHLAFWNRICLRNIELCGFSNYGTSVKAEERRSTSAATRLANDDYKKSYVAILIIFFAIVVFAVVISLISAFCYGMRSILVAFQNHVLPRIIIH